MAGQRAASIVLPAACRPRHRSEGYRVQAESRPACRARDCSAGKLPQPAEPGRSISASMARSPDACWRTRVFHSGANVSLVEQHHECRGSRICISHGTRSAAAQDPYSMDEVLGRRCIACIRRSKFLIPAIDEFHLKSVQPQLIADNALRKLLRSGTCRPSPTGVSIDLAEHRSGHRHGSTEARARRQRRQCTGRSTHGTYVDRQRAVVDGRHAASRTSRYDRYLRRSGGNRPWRHVVADFGILGRVEMRLGA